MIFERKEKEATTSKIPVEAKPDITFCKNNGDAGYTSALLVFPSPRVQIDLEPTCKKCSKNSGCMLGPGGTTRHFLFELPLSLEDANRFIDENALCNPRRSPSYKLPLQK